MSSPSRNSTCPSNNSTPSTWSTAPVNRPGASFNNPLIDSEVTANPSAEQFYVLDLTRGIVRTTATGARDYRSMGFPVFDGFGNRVNNFDGELVAALHRFAEDDRENAFFFQNDEVWEIIDMKTAIAEAVGDETIYYDFQTKRFKRVKKSESKGTPKKGPNDKRGPSGGSPGAGSGAGLIVA